MEKICIEKSAYDFRICYKLANCSECQVACHISGINSEVSWMCDVMDHSMPEESRHCLVCPGKCLRSKHSNDPFKWICDWEVKLTNALVIKGEYETNLGQVLTLEEFSEAVNVDMKAKQKELTDNAEFILNSFKPFIDSWPIINHIIAFIDAAIRCETDERNFGFQERLRKLEDIRLVSVQVLRNCCGIDPDSDIEILSDID